MVPVPAGKLGPLGYRSLCPLAPVSTIICWIIAGAVDLEEKVEEWVKTVLSIEAEPPSGGVGERETWDWMDEEYARRKLGLPP